MKRKLLHLLSIFRLKPSLSDFKSVVTENESSSSFYNNKRVTYLNPKNNALEIGYIEYNLYTGKICLFFMTDETYRNRGLGGQILEKALTDIKKSGTNRAWLVTAKCPHPFWERNGFTYANPPDGSVTFHGYTKDL